MQYSDFEKKLQHCRHKHILLGFSGGADSCALFLILEYWSRKIPFEFTAVHFEHGLRGQESLQDAEFCGKIAEKYKVNFQKFHLNVPENTLKNETMEAAARRLRLEKWHEICRNMTDFEIHLAHHANDLAENVFLRLFRGANVSGLSGLREFSVLGKLPIRRIMLNFSRREVEDFLKRENFTKYCIDQTNSDCTIGRNYLRNKLLNDIDRIFPYAFKGILRSAEVCETDAEFIENCADLKYAEIADSKYVANEFYQNLHSALLVRVLRTYLSSQLQYEYIPDHNFTERFASALKNDSFEQKIELDHEHFYIRRQNLWCIEKKINPLPSTVFWNWQEKPQIEYGDYIYTAKYANDLKDQNKFYFDAEFLTETLQISPRTAGDRFEKFGGGTTSVKEELTNHKIHGFERDKIGILRNGNGEIMLIGNFRRTSFAPIFTKNHKIIEFSVEKLKK